MDNKLELIHQYIQDNKDNITGMLTDLIRIPSVSGESTSGAMFGNACRRAILHTEGLFAEVGMDTHTQKDCAYTIGKTKGDEKTVGIFCHADVVAAVEEDWVMTKPFEPLVKDGYIVGRGADDNKSGIVNALWAIKAMQYADIMPKSTILVYAGGNEECGMSDLEIFNSENKAPDFSIIPDNAYPVCRGEKGILRFWARFRKAFESIISINGGQSLNIVLGSVDCEMKYSPILAEQLKKYCEGKNEYILTVGDTITLTAKGRSTHAAYSGDSVNALYVLVQALKGCDALGEDIKILLEAEKLVADPFSETVGLGTVDPEFKETTCANGIVRTQEGKLNLSFDTRYGTEIDIDAFVEGYRRVLDGMGADTDVTERDDGYVIPEDTPIIKEMTDTWNALTGNKDSSYLSYGGTYARHLPNAVSTGTCVGLEIEKTGLPDGHGGAHQPDEIMSIDGLMKSIEVLIQMILKADETLHG